MVTITCHKTQEGALHPLKPWMIFNSITWNKQDHQKLKITKNTISIYFKVVSSLSSIHIQKLTQILFRISEDNYGGWGLWCRYCPPWKLLSHCIIIRFEVFWTVQNSKPPNTRARNYLKQMQMSYENLVVFAYDCNHEKYNFTSKLYIFLFIIILYEQRFHCVSLRSWSWFLGFLLGICEWRRAYVLWAKMDNWHL